MAGRRFDPAELDRVRSYVVKPIAARETAPWWQVLGLDPFAEQDAIRSAFRRLAREHHPDMGGDGATMANLNRAYEEALDSVVPF